MPSFYTILTDIGQAKLANAIALGQTIEITDLAVGDGNGALPVPETSRTALVNEVRRAPINLSEVDDQNPNWVVVEQVLPPDVGGWTIREIGVFDIDGDLIGYGNYPETYKPVLSEGSSRTQTVRFVIEVSDTAAVTLKVDPSVVLATREFAQSAFREFGLGADAANLANINTIDKTGFYITGAGTAGTAPPDGMAGTLLHIERGSSNQATQIFDTLRASGQTQLVYTRTKDNTGNWTSWGKVALSVPGGISAFSFLSAGDGVANANSIPGDEPHWLEVTNNAGDGSSGNQLFRMNSYGDIAYGGNIHSCRYFGSEAAPAAIADETFIMSWGFRGFNGSQLSQSAGAFQCVTTENWTETANGVRFQFEVVGAGTLVREKVLEIGTHGLALSMDGTTGWHPNYALIEIAGKGTALRGHKSQAELVMTNNAFFDVAYKYGANGYAHSYRQGNDGEHVWQSAPNGISGDPLVFVDVMKIDENYNWSVFSDNDLGNGHKITKVRPSNAGNPILTIENTSQASAVIYAVNGTGANAANSAMVVNKDNATGRSINAAGTVNASGADYAEYMRKSEDCASVAKGDVVGIDRNGEVTDKFSSSVSFMIKSTDPSYVGGDRWGTEEYLGIELGVPEEGANTDEEYQSRLKDFKQALEVERQHWDRIAFSGRVPVNITGTAEPGDHLVPEEGTDDAIIVRAHKSPSFDQYMASVGKVIALLEDGRPLVIVKAC